MDLRRLKHLVALADARNFGRAAKACHISQSAFSRSIQSAEEELGLQLFDRGNAEVRCSAAGTFVVERARKLLFENHCLERDVSLYRERLIGDLAFGVSPYPAATLAPQLLQEIRRHYGAVKVRVEVNNAQYLLARLRAEELDFYIADVRSVPAVQDLSIQRIGQAMAGLYVRPGHPLLDATQPLTRDTLAYGLASAQVPESVRKLLSAQLQHPPGQPLPLAVECDDLHLLKSIAMHTDTVLACAEVGVQQEVAQGTLVRLSLTDTPPIYSDMGIVSLKGRSYSLMAQLAVDFLADMAAPSRPPA